MSTRSQPAWTLRSVIFAVAVQTAIAQAAAGTGYLPRLGPTPLRLSAKMPSTKKFVLPPLDQEAAQPVAQATPASTSLPDRNSRSPSAVNAADFKLASYLNPELPFWAGAIERALSGTLPASGVENEPLDSLPALPEVNTGPIVTPQMLVEYFKAGRGSTNAASVSVTVPVDFSPPTAPPSFPSSQATYSTPR